MSHKLQRLLILQCTGPSGARMRLLQHPVLPSAGQCVYLHRTVMILYDRTALGQFYFMFGAISVFSLSVISVLMFGMSPDPARRM